MKKTCTQLLFFLGILFLSQAIFAQQVTVKGKVTSAEDGSLLPGVSIVIQNTNTGTVSDIDGSYSIDVP
ncbi:MAG: carboxypeptidase-like regulatory domain-containing protein, partial [Cyclobacteriaceae bacterium]